MNVGSVIKYYRSKHNLTQQQLADGICSISHLSKIESNSYIPHESTTQALLAKMGVRWKTEIDKHKQLERELGKFIDCSIYFDLNAMRKQYEELEQEIDYIQSTELVNQFELYKFRYYIFDEDYEQAECQKNLLERLKGSFTAPEKWLHQFFLSVYYSMKGQAEHSLKLLENLEEGIQSIPQKFEGEYYYQKARLLILHDRYERSAYYAELAVQHYQLHYNYIRLLHAQLLLAINYTKRNLLVQAVGLYEALKRNSQITGQTELYYQTVYNYAELLKQREKNDEALLQLQEIKDRLPKDSYFYKAVLVSALEAAVETGEDVSHLIHELKAAITDKNDTYFQVYAEYFEKRSFSQSDLLDYYEEKMFPFFRRNGYIKEAKKVSSQLALFYQKKKEWEKAHFYSTYHETNGGEFT
ncbi:helix-turn-helix transcriptional regulator [Planococcus sp. N028]|uniref:Helix-turn-helix transcriptional regulator n=1 Tax=Planococcus shixiaomingii TaxID=3058393 RepID=A0ABT8N404_9BACL|nr:helix-turn-helix transcriptional regulator [Planococcus sp. N028]MDN7242610.1 helix-turn-helix transcriptional regulator [Planococcus sp. N028]